MNDLPMVMKHLLATFSEYLDNGEYKTLFRIVLVISSALMIYTAGKSLGEFIYYMTN